jgi:hypothetical protein
MRVSLSRIAGQPGQQINGGDPWSYLWAPIVWQPAALPLLLAPLEVGLPALASARFEASLPVWMTRSPRAEQV